MVKLIVFKFPFDDYGEPDCDYMKQYVKNMIMQKYKQYLEFFDKREEVIGNV